MATTTNFGWETPDDTDLVKDGAAAIRTALGGVDTSFVDLKGGTTGQVLSKASNTDLDYTWVTTDDANAIQNAIVDAKGDLIAATAADTPARLAVGTNGQVLTADSTAATGLAWAAAPAGASTLAQVATGSFSGTSVTISSLSSYDTIILAMTGVTWGTGASNIRVRINSLTSSSYLKNGFGVTSTRSAVNQTGTSFALQDVGDQSHTDANNNYFYIFTNCKNAGYTSVQGIGRYVASDTSTTAVSVNGVILSNETVSSLVLATGSGYTFNAGTYTVWGA